MAIDTAAKRQASLLDVCGMLFPDGSIDSADRESLLGSYTATDPYSHTPPTLVLVSGGNDGVRGSGGNDGVRGFGAGDGVRRFGGKA